MLNFRCFVVIADTKDFFSLCCASFAVKLGRYDEKNLSY